jgi:hypothetical protein
MVGVHLGAMMYIAVAVDYGGGDNGGGGGDNNDSGGCGKDGAGDNCKHCICVVSPQTQNCRVDVWLPLCHPHIKQGVCCSKCNQGCYVQRLARHAMHRHAALELAQTVQALTGRW